MTQRKPTKRPKQNKVFPAFCFSLRILCVSACVLGVEFSTGSLLGWIFHCCYYHSPWLVLRRQAQGIPEPFWSDYERQGNTQTKRQCLVYGWSE